MNISQNTSLNGLNNTINEVYVESISLEMVIPLMICCVVAVASNLFVCYLILTVRRLKTTTNVFVFSLCICNIMFAAVLYVSTILIITTA